MNTKHDSGVTAVGPTPPQNPYTSGPAAENWRRGFNGERLIAVKGSAAERFYREGAAARKQHDAGVNSPAHQPPAPAPSLKDAS